MTASRWAPTSGSLDTACRSRDPVDIRKLVTPLIADALPDGWMVGEEDLLVNPTGTS